MKELVLTRRDLAPSVCRGSENGQIDAFGQVMVGNLALVINIEMRHNIRAIRATRQDRV